MNKLSKFYNELSNYTDIKPEIYLSPATGYRARAEFGFSKHSYTMVEDRQKIFMDNSSALFVIVKMFESDSKVLKFKSLPILSLNTFPTPTPTFFAT